MPIAFRCSSCAQVLKVPDTLAGSKGKCPKCGAILAIPGANNAAPQAPARKTRPPQPAIVEEKAVRMRPRAEAANDDDSDAKEGAIPHSRNARKKKKRKASPVLLFGLLGGGCVFLLLMCSGVGGLAWWYFFSGGLDDDLKFMPNNAQMVASIRLDQLMKSGVFQELKREVPDVSKAMSEADKSKELGLGVDDIDQIVVGGGTGTKEFIAVIHTKKAVTAADLRSKDSKIKYTESKVGKYVLMEPQTPFSPAFCVVDKNRVLVGDKEAMRTVLSRDKKPEFSKNLQAAIKEVDFSKTIVFAMDTQSAASTIGGAAGLGFFGGKNDMLSAFEKTNAVAMQAKIASDVRIDVTLVCKDAASANDIKKLIDGFLVMGRGNKTTPKEINDLMELHLKVDGNKVTGYNTFKVGPLIKAYKEQKGKF
jgi:phage FluMu protein Com